MALCWRLAPLSHVKSPKAKGSEGLSSAGAGAGEGSAGAVGVGVAVGVAVGVGVAVAVAVAGAGAGAACAHATAGATSVDPTTPSVTRVLRRDTFASSLPWGWT